MLDIVDRKIPGWEMAPGQTYKEKCSVAEL